MNKKRLKLICMFFSIAALLGCHSEKHLSPEMELGESVIIHSHQD
ncbi:hypothetical protein [Bacillus sp. AK031]